MSYRGCRRHAVNCGVFRTVVGSLKPGGGTHRVTDDSDLSGNQNGIYGLVQTGTMNPLYKDTAKFDGLTITDTLFNDDREQAMYFEGLSNAHFTRVTITNTGQTNCSAGPASCGYNRRGVQLNLKNGDYENITFTDSTISNGLFEGLTITPRGYSGDSGSYTPSPATLTAGWVASWRRGSPATADCSSSCSTPVNGYLFTAIRPGTSPAATWEASSARPRDGSSCAPTRAPGCGSACATPSSAATGRAGRLARTPRRCS